MSVRIRLPALFADRIDGLSAVQVQGQTVTDALKALAKRHPPLRTLVLGRDGAVNPMMAVFLNNRQLGPNQLESSVTSDDEIEIVPAIEGG